jgi:hypothetical protein
MARRRPPRRSAVGLLVGVVLGTVAARRAGESGWAWSCVVVGVPGGRGDCDVRARRAGEDEPAPLAGLLASLAGLLTTLGVDANAVGGG